MSEKIPKELQTLFFGVTKQRADAYIKNTLFSPHLDHWIITQTKQGPMVVNACSKNYELIPNKELIMPVYNRIATEHDIKLVVRQFGHSKFYVDFIFLDSKASVMKKDTIYPRVRLNNSYDGSVKYSYDYGFYRLVCENGLMVPEKGAEYRQMKLMHTPRAGDGRALELTLESVESFLGDWKKLLKQYDPLLERKLKMDEALKRMEEIREEGIFPARSMELATGQLQKEANLGLPVTDFLLYNAMNYALHSNPNSSMKTHKADKIDRKILDYLLEN